MKAFLYPYHYIEPLEYLSDTDEASVASSLLYLESITLGRTGSPEELHLPSSMEEISEEMWKIEDAHGIDTIDQFLMGAHHSPDLSCDNVAMLNYMTYRTKIAHFEHVYKPLIQEGVIQLTSLAEQIPDFALSDFVHVLDEFNDWPTNDNDVEEFTEALSDAGSIGLSSLHLREIMKGEGSDELLQLLNRTDGNAKLLHWRTAFLMDVFSQSLISEKLGLPLTSFSERHFEFRNRCVSKLQSISRPVGETALHSSANLVAQQVFAKTLTALPAIIPRSPESILAIRQQLADELQEFRAAVFDLAEDLLKENAESIGEKDIEQMVKQRFVRPAEALQRKLAHPTGDLTRNLLSDSSVVSGVTSFFGMFTGFGAPAVCAAVLALAVPTLTASVKTLIERQKEVEQSGLAFLIKSQQQM